MRDAADQFEEAGFVVVLVGMSGVEEAEHFRSNFSLSYPLICDPGKKLYRLYSLGRASIISLTSPVLLLRGMRTMSRGYLPSVTTGDVMQLPGVFLVDTQGYVRFSHFSRDPSDYPPIDTLLGLKKLCS